MAKYGEEFRVQISGTRRLVLRRPSPLADWMLLGEARDASGAEAIIDAWNVGTWTAHC